jgi:glycosyltransferase involved in cell wall biosynthesis
LLANRTISEVVPSSPKLKNVFDDMALQGKPGRILWDQWAAYSAAKRTGNEWLFLPKGFASFVRRPPCKLASFVHDDIVCHYAQNYPGSVSKMEESYFLKSFRSTLRNSDVIFTNSEFSRGRILERAVEFELTEPTVVVCGIGFEHIPAATKTESNDVIVLVGKLPHKCSVKAIEFMKRWQEESHFDGRVHFIGSLPDETKFASFGNWIHSPRLPDSEYEAVMKLAQTMVYFSEYEGFGMPPVEAILSGVSAVYSEIPATSECMNGAGFAFSSSSFESFFAAMTYSMEVSPKAMENWQVQLREAHSWQKTTNIVLTELSRLSD